MKDFNNTDFENYKNEVKEKWGNTDAYKEYSQKSKGYSNERIDSMTDGLNNIMGEFAICMNGGGIPQSDDAQSLVKKLQGFITENFYTCTNEILAGLGQMYVADERFKNNIDKHSVGTAEFVSRAIEYYVR
ncbi:MAG: TipAS antibiotic-recognition domain-containing protein [Clostridia bacterium]|nr:TipAS antibiotic-recognition domain-containing protein [Clostridia bacterium]